MTVSEINTLRTLQRSCVHCKQRDLCLPAGLTEQEMQSVGAFPTKKKVAKGQTLYRSGDPHTHLYIIKLGSFKSTVASAGIEQVVGFHMTGETLGSDGIPTKFHDCTLTALEDSELCQLPYANLDDFCREVPKLADHIRVLLSREIVRGHSNLLMLGSMSSTRRLAAFLLDLSTRFEQRGFSRTEFVLRMTRADIGSFLGLKIETVSRTLSKFTELNLIEIHQKHVHIINAEGLRSLLHDS